MKIKVTCKDCNEKVSIEIDDEKRFVNYLCSAGHRNLLVVQSHISEILFDRACIFYQKGHYREAIFNFYGALEKYRELYIKFLLLHHNSSHENITNLWKEIKSSSERQYGAYCLMQSIVENTINISIDQNIRKIRNDVIHAGKLPTENESYRFGESVFTLIQKDHSFLKKKGDYLSMLVQEIFYQDQVDETAPATTIIFPGFQLMGLEEDKGFGFILGNIKKHLNNPRSWYFQGI